ncbi:MAG: hypothetical protein HDQ96_14270 [Lachnospiraceae bacterium]|nr:hypothetical protein [Lachnospiraceae bacterium]
MYYDKRIRYLSYYESDIKLQNAGYVKFQVRDSLCQMIIYVKGPRLMGSGEARVYLLSEKPGEKEKDGLYERGRKNSLEKHVVGTLSIRNGQGHCAVRLNAENMADSGLWYDEICGIKIELHEYQYLESQWSVVNFMPRRQQMQKEENAGYKLRKPQNGSRNTERKSREDSKACVEETQHSVENRTQKKEPVEINLIVTPVSEKSRVEKLIKEEQAEEIIMEEIQKEDFLTEMPEKNLQEEKRNFREGGTEESIEVPKEVTITEREMFAEQVSDEEERSMQELLKEKIEQGMKEAEEIETGDEGEVRFPEQELQSDKWEQLRNTYPVVHPIREDEEYLKIEPRDFVIFTEKYQELVHNSFLLHGYYNYKHLILGRKEKDSKAIYYLGVPGTFHDREKAVAVMFGFEAFDGKREPAQNGDFGYYLRKVEI